jgi:hypothetical protein
MYDSKLFYQVVEESKSIYHEFIKKLMIVERTEDDSNNPIIEEAEAINNVILYFLENHLIDEEREFNQSDREQIANLIFNYLDENYSLLKNCNGNKSCINKFRQAYIKISGESLRLFSI